LKLKGIDGNFYKQWSMRFNLMIHVKPYQLLGQRNVHKLEHISFG
jgi:hypothetical protein